MAEVTVAEGEIAMEEVMNLLEAEPSTSQPTGLTASGTDIPSLREQLAVLVSTGKAKEATGVQSTHEQVKRLSDKDVQKYAKIYETYVGGKTTESLIDSVICLASKALGWVVKIKDPDAFQKERKNDYIINQGLSNLAGNAAFSCSCLLAVANAALITTKHIDFSKESSPMLTKAEPVAE